jgi:hypothetical protein
MVRLSSQVSEFVKGRRSDESQMVHVLCFRA